MAMTNAERQARWRERRDARIAEALAKADAASMPDKQTLCNDHELQTLRNELAERDREIEKLRTKLREKTTAAPDTLQEEVIAALPKAKGARGQLAGKGGRPENRSAGTRAPPQIRKSRAKVLPAPPRQLDEKELAAIRMFSWVELFQISMIGRENPNVLLKHMNKQKRTYVCHRAAIVIEWLTSLDCGERNAD